MNKQVLIAIILILNISFTQATTFQQTVKQGKQLFRKIKNHSDIGKSLVEAIQLEISASEGEDQTIVSKVIELLRQIQQSLMDQQGGLQEEVDGKNVECHSEVDDLQQEIKTLETQIEEVEDRIPLLRDAFEAKQNDVKVVSEEISFYQSEIIRMDNKNELKQTEYEEAQEEYQQVIGALTQAKFLIKQLKSSFLQKQSAQTSLAQVNEHFERSMNFVKSGHNRAFLKYLLQVTQLADQDQVQDILDIIDELIQSTNSAADTERNAEGRRNTLYQTKRGGMKQKLEAADLKQKQAEADVRTAETRLNQLVTDANDAKVSQNAKKETLEDHMQACEDQTASLNERIISFQELLDLIRQVLVLLENSSIQGSKQMMSDLEDDGEEEQEESLLGDYSQDRGQLPSRDGDQEESEQQEDVFLQYKTYKYYDPLEN